MSGFDYVDLESDIEKCKLKLEDIEKSSSSPQIDGEQEAIIQADILEVMLFDLIKNHGWFGKDTTAVLPSLYDDLFLGNDLVLEHGQGDYRAHSGIGIDVTLGENSFDKKIQYTKRKLQRDGLGFVKYFRSPDGTYEGKIFNIPHFVIGLDRETMFKVTQDWTSENGVNKLKNSPIKKGLITLMMAQCDEFSSCTTNPKVKEKYQSEKRILEKTLREMV